MLTPLTSFKSSPSTCGCEPTPAEPFLLNATGAKIVGSLKTFVGHMLSGPSLADFNTQTAPVNLGQGIKEAGIALAPLLAGVVIVAVIGNIAGGLVGPLVNTVVIRADLAGAPIFRELLGHNNDHMQHGYGSRRRSRVCGEPCCTC